MPTEKNSWLSLRVTDIFDACDCDGAVARGDVATIDIEAEEAAGKKISHW